MIEILSSGLMNSVQDLGRPGYLDQGIGRGGAMDRPALRIANLLAGNAEGAAAIEVAVFPFRLRFLEPAGYAVTGASCRASLNGQPLPPWWSGTADAGDELRLEPPTAGSRAYITIGGGIDVPEVLRARATDLKSVFGGLEGRALARGDRLATGSRSTPAAVTSSRSIDPFHFRDTLGGMAGGEPLTLRIMPGAEFDAFNHEARQALFGMEFRVSADNNRQGMRLEGSVLALTRKTELLSHGIMPGTIQVPPSGQAVIQLAEANTCGGYPKIAHVIETDLWKLGQAPSGAAIRFEVVGRDTAVAAIRDEELRLRRLAHLLGGGIARKAS
ncbi:MAG: biotin-dependent carboxyltransferase family protein [Rhizobium sp.]|nr:biotin-dependent carboxyltransferase family protein [Rhizobium sp.]